MGDTPEERALEQAELVNKSKELGVVPLLKPGWRSSEFVLSTVATIAGLFIASGVLPETNPAVKIAGLVVTVLAALGYAHQRTKLKQ